MMELTEETKLVTHRICTKVLSPGSSSTPTPMEPPKLLIASMNMRGKWAPRPTDSEVLNVTSMQGKIRQERLDYSPMHLENYKGFACFENYWQSGKRWKELLHHIKPDEHREWVKMWSDMTKPTRKSKKTKGMTVHDAIFGGVPMDYVTSRKLVYVPEYYEYMTKRSKTLQKYKDYLKNGKTVVIYDFDGPRKADGGVEILKCSKPLLIDKLNDTSFPFGHGYVVAMALLGIEPGELL